MFSPLPMTRKEGMSIANLLDGTGRYDVTYFESGQAREGVLKILIRRLTFFISQRTVIFVNRRRIPIYQIRFYDPG